MSPWSAIMGNSMDHEKENLKKVLDQIEACNVGDIERCLSYWADDLKVILLPKNETIFSSKQEVRKHLKNELTSGAKPSVEVFEPKSDGPHVYLVEEKTRFGKPTGKMKFTYLVEDGLITTMWGDVTTLTKEEKD